MKNHELPEQKERITKEWYKTIKRFEPIEGAQYSWIWDYAKYRLEWAFEKTRYVEEKSLSLLKLVLAISAGSWAVFTFLATKNLSMGVWSKNFAYLAICCLAASGVFCLMAAWPSEHVYPQSEDKAIECANLYKRDDAARASFALIIGDSSEQERLVTAKKAKLVNIGAGFVLVAVIAFTLSLLAR
jgi:hypothetical protein